MMQLIHDVAPGASQSFHTAFNGLADFANGILELASAGADVIVDDVIYFAEPMFQDGAIAQSVDTVVSQGVSYFSSAGNSGTLGYASDFRSGPLFSVGGFPYTGHDFDPGGGVDILQAITVPLGATITFDLQWDEPFFSVSGAPGSSNDVDIFIVNAAGTSIVGGSAGINFGDDPLEFFQFANNTGSTLVHVLIGHFFGAGGGSAPGQLKYVIFGAHTTAGPFVTIDDFSTASGTVFGHANAARR